MGEVGKVTPGSTIIRRTTRERPHSDDKGRQQEDEAQNEEEQNENSEHDEENSNNAPGDGHIDVYT